MFSGAGRGLCLLCSSLDLSSHASLVLFPSLPCAPTLRGEQRVLSHLAGWTPGWDGAGFSEMRWVLWQHRCCPCRCPCSLQAGAGSSPSSSWPGAAVPCCIQGHMGLGSTGLGLGAWSGAARGSLASLGSSQELFDASGSRCAAAAGFLHTAVGAYSALGFCRCHFPPSRPFVKELCVSGGRGGCAAGGSVCRGGCRAATCPPSTFGFYQGFHAARCI